MSETWGIEEEPVVPIYETDNPLVPISDPKAKRVNPEPPGPMSTYTERLLVVIPESRKRQAEAVALTADPSTEGDTFTVGLSPTGSEPATHFWCGWVMTKTQRGRIIAIEKSADGQIFDMEEYTPEKVLEELGLKRIEPEEIA